MRVVLDLAFNGAVAESAMASIMRSTAMRIGVTSQNFRTVTGHAGESRRFVVFESTVAGSLVEVERLDLPKSMAMHAYLGDIHPLFGLDMLVTAECDPMFRRRLARHGVCVVTTDHSDPQRAAYAAMIDPATVGVAEAAH
jgi:hypothetical protein